MSVSAAASSSSTTSTSSSSNSSLAMTSTQFLQLIAQQLQDQDPSNPTDTTAFTTQMLDYANFNAQQAMQTSLSDINSTVDSFVAANSVNYIGDTVTASGSQTALANGTATWNYTVGSNAANTTLTVSDSNGNVVYSTTGSASEGSHSFNWNGKTTSGTQEANGGTYTLAVSSADASGNTVTTSTEVSGTVSGVTTSNGVTSLTVNGVSVPLSSITAISK